MSKKPIDSVQTPVVFNAFVLIGINVSIIELGRKGLWYNEGVGFSPWYPFGFAIIHFLFWAIKIYVDRLCRWWWIIIEIAALIFFLCYNLNALGEIMYASYIGGFYVGSGLYGRSYNVLL